MPRPKIDDDELLGRLSLVFRDHGYGGASLSRISAATGLKRASLYHRFPGGKAEMAEAVLAKTESWLGEHVLAPLREPGDPAKRVRRMAMTLKTFYEGGGRSCLLDTMTMGQDDDAIRQHVASSLRLWIDAMRDVAVSAGLPRALARRRATDAMVRIQGSLVLARGTADTAAFRQVLRDLPGLLTEAE